MTGRQDDSSPTLPSPRRLRLKRDREDRTTAKRTFGAQGVSHQAAQLPRDGEAESRAAIHVSVTGENTHHMVEACFKGVGRALRQALRREGEELPSTKGVL